MAAQPEDDKDIIIKLATLAQAANADPKKLPALRQFMTEHDEVFGSANLLLTTARNSLIRKVAGSGGGSQALYMREVEGLKAKLTEPDDSPLVQLIIDRILMCFLRNCLAEMVMTAGEGRVTYKQSEYLDKELTRAHSRFVRAVEALARVRVLAEAAKIAKVKTELIEARASEARMARANGVLRLLNSATR